jgi:hypothetical protein
MVVKKVFWPVVSLAASMESVLVELLVAQQAAQLVASKVLKQVEKKALQRDA